MDFKTLMYFAGMNDSLDSLADLDAHCIASFLSDALAGSWWCGVCNDGPEFDDPGTTGPTIEHTMANLLKAGKTVFLFDMEDSTERFELRLDKFDKGADIFFTKHPGDARAAIREHGFDGETADTLLQCILFGEIVFG